MNWRADYTRAEMLTADRTGLSTPASSRSTAGRDSRRRRAGRQRLDEGAADLRIGARSLASVPDRKSRSLRVCTAWSRSDRVRVRVPLRWVRVRVPSGRPVPVLVLVPVHDLWLPYV